MQGLELIVNWLSHSWLRENRRTRIANIANVEFPLLFIIIDCMLYTTMFKNPKKCNSNKYLKPIASNTKIKILSGSCMGQSTITHNTIFFHLQLTVLMNAKFKFKDASAYLCLHASNNTSPTHRIMYYMVNILYVFNA